MSDEKALVPTTMSEVMSIGKMMAESGFFSDARQASQAVVKILAGREMGFGPFAAMANIHIIKGKPTVGANLMAASIKGDPRYDYRVTRMSEEDVEIDFFERRGDEWIKIGVSGFSIEDAQRAGLLNNHNWVSYPRNMLYARAMSNGVKWFCPDAFGGTTVYAPDELGAPVDAEGDVITVTEPEPEPAPHWIKNDNTRKAFWAYTQNELGLSDAEVHEALGVEYVADFDGSKKDAITKLKAYIDDKATAEQAQAEAEAVPE